jgi:GT2 family glycosyltransferase
LLLSILIVNFNGLRHLRECFDSVSAQSFKDFEVVMVDNGSSDGSIDFVEAAYPFVRIVKSETNLGFAGGNNLGAAHCRGDFLFLLNNDTRLAPDALESLATAIVARPGFTIFACFMLDYHHPDRVDSAGDRLYTNGAPFAYAGFLADRFNRETEVLTACAGAAVYRRDVFERLGGFDEDFFLIFEDTDLSLRARHAGERILFLPQAKVYHKGSASLGGKRSKTTFYYSERNFPLLLIKNFPASSLWRAMAGLMVLKPIRFYHAVRFGCLGPWARANVDGLRLIPRMWRKRKKNLRESHLKSAAFGAQLRRGWFRDRVKLFLGQTDRIP